MLLGGKTDDILFYVLALLQVTILLFHTLGVRETLQKMPWWLCFYGRYGFSIVYFSIIKRLFPLPVMVSRTSD